MCLPVCCSMFTDAEEDGRNETSYFRGIILSDDSTEQPTTREAWPSKEDSEC